MGPLKFEVQGLFPNGVRGIKLEFDNDYQRAADYANNLLSSGADEIVIHITKIEEEQ